MERGKFQVIVTEIGSNRTKVVALISKKTEASLIESIKLPGKLPCTLQQHLSQEEAKSLAEELEKVGAKVKIDPE